MIKRRIVTDSSSDITTVGGRPVECVPLKIITAEKEYIDDESLDVEAMLRDLQRYKGKSRSSCPNPDDYLKAFEGADEVFCVTITSGLSGSFNSAKAAANLFSENGGRTLVVDSLSTGPESALLLEKLSELADSDMTFEEIETAIGEYQKTTHLSFALESLTNLSRNGRVSPIVAKICGVLGIRVVGKASESGTLEVTGKARGERNALMQIFSDMKKNGYSGEKVKIHHAVNEKAANALSELILSEFPEADVRLGTTRGLCSFYAEMGGLLVGYEG